MATNTEAFNVFIGYDDREAIAAHVLAFSIAKRTKYPLKVNYIKHRELRKRGLFQRPWLIEGSTGQYRDLQDDRPFSTQFSHTRFLVPELMRFKGWALFLDCDMIFRSDIKKLIELRDDKKAIMCVKHNHVVDQKIQKMDDRVQLNYHRKNWSSFVLWNCGHEANRAITKEKINYMKGYELHAFNWLKDQDIGSIPFTYNYISGVSPKIDQVVPPMIDPNDKSMEEKIKAMQPKIDVIHYTEGGPWFDNCKEVPFASFWDDEYRAWIDAGSPIYDGKLIEVAA